MKSKSKNYYELLFSMNYMNYLVSISSFSFYSVQMYCAPFPTTTAFQIYFLFSGGKKGNWHSVARIKRRMIFLTLFIQRGVLSFRRRLRLGKCIYFSFFMAYKLQQTVHQKQLDFDVEWSKMSCDSLDKMEIMLDFEVKWSKCVAIL